MSRGIVAGEGFGFCILPMCHYSDMVGLITELRIGGGSHDRMEFRHENGQRTQFTTLIVHPRRAKGAAGEVIWYFGRIREPPHRINMIDLHIGPWSGGAGRFSNFLLGHMGLLPRHVAARPPVQLHQSGPVVPISSQHLLTGPPCRSGEEPI